MSDYKTIKRFANSPEANMAKDYLIEKGIDAVLNDEHTGEIFNPVVKGVKLDVPIEQFEEARRVIDLVDNNATDGDSEIIDILEDCDALLSGHFLLTSKLHSDKYIEKIKIIQQPDQVVKVAGLMVSKLSDVEADVVIGLAMGGIVLGYEVAKQMKKKFIFTQRKNGKMIIRDGFDLRKGMKAIVVEDVVTTGGSVKEVLQMLQNEGLMVQAVSLIVDRTGGKIDFGVRKEALLEIKVNTYQPDSCPMCKEGYPLSTPGSSDK